MKWKQLFLENFLTSPSSDLDNSVSCIPQFAS